MADFFSAYIHYVRDQEPPNIFNRWAAIVSLGAFLERDVWFKHGHFTVFPNLYVMLLGKSGTRKTRAIKLVKKLIQTAGYSTIAADKTSKEKFLIDLSMQNLNGTNGHDILDSVFGNREFETTPCFIMADEFNSFFGNDVLSFVADLGVFFDYEGVYRNRLKNSKSVEIPNPIISILTGNTPTMLCKTFPPEVLGQGFFSRLLMVYSDVMPWKRNTFPPEPDSMETAELVNWLKVTKSKLMGEINIDLTARNLLDKLYKSFKGLEDVRFESYSNRRFEQLIKLCVLHAIADNKRSIDELCVIRANTVLTYTERFMSKGLGEFGRAKNADASHKIIEFIGAANKVVAVSDIWKQVRQDLDNINQLSEILRGLVSAQVIQQVRVDKMYGFLPIKKTAIEVSQDTVDWNYLTEEERKATV
jgi:hypothetical protein